MGNEKIVKELESVKLDKGLVVRIREHKRVSGVPIATFLERLAEAELNRLYPNGGK